MFWNNYIDFIFEVSEIIIVFRTIRYFLSFLLFERQDVQCTAYITHKENVNIYGLTIHDLEQTPAKH